MANCPQCGEELGSSDPAGLCPKCLIQGVFDSSVGAGEPGTETIDMAAVTAGDWSSATDCDEFAHFLYASLQGAILESKVERSSAPLQRFKKVVFSTLLR